MFHNALEAPMSDEDTQEQSPNPEAPAAEGLSADDLKAALAKARREAAGYRTQLRESEETSKKVPTLEERIQQLEADQSKSDIARWRSDAALESKLSAEDRDLFLTASDRDSINAQAKAIAERLAAGPVGPKPTPLEGGEPATKSSPESEFLQQLKSQRQ